MNEEELKKEKYQGIAIIPKNKSSMKEFVGKTRAWIEGFQKGKLEKMKEELRDLKEIYDKDGWDKDSCLMEKIKQLQKEIGGKEK